MKTIIVKSIGWYLNGLSLLSPGYAGKKGFHLFCTPVRVRMKPYHRQFLDTAEKKLLRVNGENIQVYRWGTGEKNLLFLHGWQSHSFRWKAYVEALPKDRFTIYALDAPAHGLSGGKHLHLPKYASVIRAFIESTGPIDTVVSHSLGSFASLYALHQHTGLPVKKLVVTGIPGEVSEFMVLYKNLLGLSDRTMRAIYHHFPQAVIHPPDYFSAIRFAQNLALPGLIVHDAKDEEAPYHHALGIHRAWQGAELMTTQGLGHNLKSKEVLQRVLAFIEAPVKQPQPVIS